MSNLEVVKYVNQGGRLEKPVDCPDAIYELLQQTWREEPDERPTTTIILEVLDGIFDDLL
jgi:hypothetical protein